MPIALLKFPYDLLGEVFKQCNPLELYFLSKCSKKAQKTVKLGGSMNWKICYWGREQILIWRDDLNYIFDPTDKPEDYFKIESCESMKIPKEGAFDMFFYLIETFGMLGEDDYIFMCDAVKVYKDDGTEAWLDVELGDVSKLEFLVWDPDRDMWEDEELVPSDDERYEDEEFDDEEFDDEETEDEEPDEEESDEEGFDGEEPES
ncbi:Protein CBG13633 [Caenorhabditis briggsae]|uniref:Protein CBG13633 n=1 Tax=Caenorhabditis briggsae TaxID=6238 RepID=A8XIC8_CAEBR|nr:Protein CBG13633 [Caenorhabditis briggsae]CAP32402.1 Protein CBG13633 [Caenorhabditis briggsae]